MDASYITPFIDSTRSVFSTMLQLPVKCGTPVAEQAIPAVDCDVSGIIGLSGDVMGTVLLCFPLEVAEKVVTKFVGMKVDTDSGDFADAIGELVNMVSGGAKAKFTGKDVSISCPSVVLGTAHRVGQMSDSVCIRIPCSSECGDFAVEVSMRPGSTPSDSTETSASASA